MMQRVRLTVDTSLIVIFQVEEKNTAMEQVRIIATMVGLSSG